MRRKEGSKETIYRKGERAQKLPKQKQTKTIKQTNKREPKKVPTPNIAEVGLSEHLVFPSHSRCT